MNAMSAIITTQIYRKLDKIGPNTLKIVPTSTTTAEKDLEQLAISSLKITEHLTFLTKSLHSHHSLTIHYPTYKLSIRILIHPALLTG